MLLKSSSDKSSTLSLLEQLLATASGTSGARIETELRNIRAGIKGETDSAYLIDFHFKASESWIVIHDLRFEIKDRVAQIDHLLINRYLDCYVLESKHFHAGLKITEEGEFMRWNAFKKNFDGMASPLAQNDRHIAVLRDVFSAMEMPMRDGHPLSPTFHSVVLVSPEARIDRPKVRDTSCVVKADQLYEYIRSRHPDEMGPSAGNPITKPIYRETLEDIGQSLIARDTPLAIDYSAKFGLSSTSSAIPVDILPEVIEVNHESAIAPISSVAESDNPIWHTPAPGCRTCQSQDVVIQYGKFGYYFKCAGCGTNTAIRPRCDHESHKPRLRKDGENFFQECSECGTSTLYFTNPA